MANFRRSLTLVECPSCQYTWPATEADLGLQSCPGCGIALEVKRVAIAWSYEAAVVTVVKADDDT